MGHFEGQIEASVRYVRTVSRRLKRPRHQCIDHRLAWIINAFIDAKERNHLDVPPYQFFTAGFKPAVQDRLTSDARLSASMLDLVECRGGSGKTFELPTLSW